MTLRLNIPATAATATTTSDGTFSFPFFPIDDYEIRIQADRFQTLDNSVSWQIPRVPLCRHNRARPQVT
jgi:hypothetical protein